MLREAKIKMLQRWMKLAEMARSKHIWSFVDSKDPEAVKLYASGVTQIPRLEYRLPFPKGTPRNVLAMVDKLYKLYMDAAPSDHGSEKYLSVVWLLAFHAWFPEELAPRQYGHLTHGTALEACQRAEAAGWQLSNNRSEMYAILFDLVAEDVVRIVWNR